HDLNRGTAVRLRFLQGLHWLYRLLHRQLATIQQLVAFLHRRNRFSRKVATAQAFTIDTDRTERIACTDDIRRNILTHRTGTTNHAVRTDTTELVHGSQTAQNGPIANMYVAAQLDAIGNNGVIVNLAIVSNVGVSHDPVVIANTGHAHILHRAGVDGDVFTNHIAIADFQA